MVNIDTVYQRVLAFANKEQRGYVTPQEFNLFANQAQQEVFEQYFYDLNQQARVTGNEYVYADVDDMLEEKIQIFENTDIAADIASYIPNAGGGLILPTYIYRVSKIEYDNIVPYVGTTTYDCEILKTKDFKGCILGGPLTRPNNTRPIANIRGNVMRTIGGATFSPNTPITPTAIVYLKKPTKVSWGYFVVGGKALYDTSIYDPITGLGKTTHFELHPSEETELVYKILKYAGLSMKRDDIMRGGQGMEILQSNKEKQ